MKKIFTSLLSIIVSICIYSQTQIATGNVSGVWTKANSPYIINGDIVVPSGSNLTINAGVQVLFNGHFSFTINGSLSAIGTSQDTILFTRYAQTTASKGRGLKFKDATGTSKLSYCKIEQQYESTRSGAGITISTSPISITNSVISNNLADYVGAGIYSNDGNKPVLISNCLISNNTVSGTGNYNADGGAGVNLGGDSTILTNCVITKNVFVGTNYENFEGGGAVTISYGAPFVVNNTIYLNSATKGSGIHLYGNYSRPKIINNIIWSNSGSQNGEQISIEPDYVSTPYDTLLVISNNDIQNNAIMVLARNSPSTYTFKHGKNNFALAPKFVSSTDYHLLSNSPCINKGLSIIGGYVFPDKDYGNSKRIQNNIVDVGAYETLIQGTGIPSGDVYGIWYKSKSPYLIYGECTVPANKSLTIEPGVKVLYTGNYALTVKGQLFANGSPQDSILFDRYEATTESSGKGIKLTSATGPSSLSYCIIQNQYEKTASGAGLNIIASPCTLQYSVIRNNTSECYGAGIHSTSSFDVLIKNCLITGNVVNPKINFNAVGGAGLYIDGNKTIVTNCIISKNVFNSTFGENYEGGGGITINYGTPYIINNTITQNSAYKGSGIHIYGGSSIPKIINNIIWGNTGSKNGEQVSIEPDYNQIAYNVAIVISNNDIQDNGIMVLARNSPSSFTFTTGTNNINIDPKFVNSTTDKLDLQSTSGCIGKGLVSIDGFTIPNDDYVGHARIQDGTIEMGAYEFGNTIATEVHELIVNNEIIVYPNPASQVVNINTLNQKMGQTIEILNAKAELMDTFKLENGLQVSYAIDKYPSGIYFIVFHNDHQRHFTKLIITRQ